jgi:8-oxo-dGTP diphosphatase
VVVVIRRGQRVLLIRRGAHVPFAGYWAPVSGKIERGEQPEEAVVREVREELGIAVRPLSKVWECASSDGRYWLHWWLAEPVDAEVSLRLNAREVDSARWLRPSEFRHLGSVFEADVRFFEEVFPTLAG